MWVGYLDFLVILAAFLVGSIPFSYLVARWRTGLDIRERGEGSVGARNVYHVVGPVWGVFAALLDIAKGLAVYMLASFAVRRLGVSMTALLVCGFAAPLGHNFSPFLHFRGGKGVATALGFLVGYLPYSTLAGGVVALITYLLTHDMNKVFVTGITIAVLLPPLFGAPLWAVPYAACLFILLALKKVLDAHHEREVWERDPWQKGRPGFRPESAEEDHPTEAGKR